MFSNQDTFNKLVTLLLLVYCMVMFSWSQFTGRQLNLEGFLAFVAPIVTHTIHLIDGKMVNASQKVELQASAQGTGAIAHEQ